MQLESTSDLLSFPWCPQLDKLEEAESQRKTEEEVTEPQPMVFGRFPEGLNVLVSITCTSGSKGKK